MEGKVPYLDQCNVYLTCYETDQVLVLGGYATYDKYVTYLATDLSGNCTLLAG